jgi:protein transport protein SEC61 subunit gamma-like protein
MEKKIVDKAWDIQNSIEKKGEHLGKGKYGRVLKMARNPDQEEYTKTSQITAIGILIVGVLGFFIFLLSSRVAPWIADMLGI